MLDRSGSMFGMPMQEAKKALIIALQMLTVQVLDKIEHMI